MLDAAMWWTGVAVWTVAGCVAVLLGTDEIIDRVLSSLRLKHDFVLWAFERAQRKARSGKIIG